MNKEQRRDCTTVLNNAIAEMKEEFGDRFSFESINLSELSRRTGISRARLRRLKKNNFSEPITVPATAKHRPSKLDGYTSVIDSLLTNGVRNSSVCLDILRKNGYTGGRTILSEYIASHLHLMPLKRQATEPQGKRSIRYSTEPGEVFQMDWGFTNVSDTLGQTYKVACFAMICHHCGQRYIEFFPNAKQENLFIGMLHAFCFMGVPKYVLTDNMKSVVIRRDLDGLPIWQKDYEAFMNTVGIQTKLCKPYHPYTKGSVERLIRFVKDNFLAGRTFHNISDLNRTALEWCNEQNSCYRKYTDSVPKIMHSKECTANLHELIKTDSVMFYLCPERKISFDGFVNYEGRRFGVPYMYSGSTARIMRNGDTIYVYSFDMKTLLMTYSVNDGRKDNYCEDQFVISQPEELPTAPVNTQVFQLPNSGENISFDKFDFDKE